MKIAAAILLLSATAAECKDWLHVVMVQPHPRAAQSLVYSECSVDSFGSYYVLTCDGVASGSAFTSTVGDSLTLDIGPAPVRPETRYVGECTRQGDDFACDDTIFSVID